MVVTTVSVVATALVVVVAVLVVSFMLLVLTLTTTQHILLRLARAVRNLQMAHCRNFQHPQLLVVVMGVTASPWPTMSVAQVVRGAAVKVLLPQIRLVVRVQRDKVLPEDNILRLVP